MSLKNVNLTCHMLEKECVIEGCELDMLHPREGRDGMSKRGKGISSPRDFHSSYPSFWMVLHFFLMIVTLEHLQTWCFKDEKDCLVMVFNLCIVFARNVCINCLFCVEQGKFPLLAMLSKVYSHIWGIWGSRKWWPFKIIIILREMR
jgi:hypothetical protein